MSAVKTVTHSYTGMFIYIYYKWHRAFKIKMKHSFVDKNFSSS